VNINYSSDQSCYQAGVVSEGAVERLRKVLPISTGLLYPKPLSSIIDNSDVDFPSSHSPTSPLIDPVLNAGLISVDTKVTVACQLPFNLSAMKLMLTLINSDLAVDQAEGPLQEAVDSSNLTGSCLVQIYVFCF
jgi:hypothetical protein